MELVNAAIAIGYAANMDIIQSQYDYTAIMAFRTKNRAKDDGNMQIRLLKPQHLYRFWSGLTPYRLPLDTLSEYPEP